MHGSNHIYKRRRHSSLKNLNMIAYSRHVRRKSNAKKQAGAGRVYTPVPAACTKTILSRLSVALRESVLEKKHGRLLPPTASAYAKKIKYRSEKSTEGNAAPSLANRKVTFRISKLRKRTERNKNAPSVPIKTKIVRTCHFSRFRAPLWHARRLLS